jgi:uncharacterized repeat protein (TIGR01451 family)
MTTLAIVRKTLVFVACVLAFVGASALRSSRADAAQCYVASGKTANVLCWLDMSSIDTATNAPTAMSWTLPDGSVLRGTVTSLGPTVPTATGLPTYSGSPLGNTAYTGVGGKPAFYGGGTVQVQITNLSLVDSQSNTISSFTIAGADAETLDTGDGGSAYVSWTTTGTPWSQLEVMPNTSGSSTTICSLSGLGTQNAKCVPAYPANDAAYILSSVVSTGQSVAMGVSSGSLQGMAFAVNLASVSLAKNVTSRANASDEFTVSIAQNGASIASATTTGKTVGTAQATTGTVAVLPSRTYTFSEAAAAQTNLGQYASTYACTNATASSSTALPSGIGTSFVVTPLLNDRIACAFTNTALTLTNVATTPTKTVTAGSTATASFTLTNTTALAATFGSAGPTIAPSTGSAIVPSGYVYAGTTYTTFAAMLAAVNASPTAANAAVTIGIDYTVPANFGGTVTISLGADVTLDGGTSALATATDVDTISSAGLSLTKTGTTQTSPGGLIAYSLYAYNGGPSAANGAILSDPLPAGLTITGAPSCTVTAGGAACPTVSVSGNTVTATLATFPANSGLTFSVTAAAGTASSYTNVATLTPKTGSPVSGSLTTFVAQTNGITKTVQNLTSGTAAGTSDTAVPGDLLQYVLTFANTTGVPIHNVTLADPLPANVTFSAASCGTLPSGITCTYAAPAVGATGTVTFSYVGVLQSGGTLSATINAYVK